MTRRVFGDAVWISRRVPPEKRIARALLRDAVEWVAPGHTLAQRFHSAGPVTAVSADITGPPDVANPYDIDVRFTLTLENLEGEKLSELVVEGPQLVWERFGRMLEVSPAAPPGEYSLVLRAQRSTVGWYAAAAPPEGEDDGVSPLPLVGQAFRDGEHIAGVLLTAVETVPASNPSFRHEFDLDSVVADATLHAVVLGSGVVWINGFRVGEESLEPAVTDYDRTVLYRTWSVGHLLRPGANEIHIDAGRERYAARGGDIWGWYLAPWHREPTAMLHVDIRLADGGSRSIATGGHWMTAPGAVERELLFGGEDWVLRDEQPPWEPATVVAGPSGLLRPATHPPVHSFPPKPPVTIESLDPVTDVFDFGEVMTGRIRCVVTGGKGATVSVVSGEQRGEGGEVVCNNVLVAGSAQEDTLRLERDVDSYVWEPQFSYRGFRWMQIRTTGNVRVERVRAVPLYTPLDVVGEFSASDDLVQWIDTALARTFRNNLHGIPTDTPIYEKNGWTADAHLAAEGLLHHFDLRSSFTKWMDDHVDAQSADGAIPQIVPTPGWGRESDPAWSASAVLIPWYLYREYGSVEILERYAPMIRTFADHIRDRIGDGLWPDRSWGDWLAPGGYGVGPEGMAPIGTVMTVTILQHTSWILGELGDAQAASYTDAASAVASTYHEAYFDAQAGHYSVDGVGYRQGLNILPLAFNVVPEANRGTVRASLVRDIETRSSGHLDCGAVAVRHLLPVLSEAGRDDLALTVLSQRTRPGWGVWFDQGETTLLESWDADARSRNHYFLGSAASWIQQHVGGLKLTAPGWRAFDVSPIRDDRVRHARIRHRTPRGAAEVDWQRGPGGWDVHVTVPTGSEATVKIGDTTEVVTAGEHRLRARDE